MKRMVIFALLFSILFLISPSPAKALTATPTPPVVLVKTIDTSKFSPPSPDPAGITYIPSSGNLFVTDSEVDEMPIFAGKNIFEITPSGNLVNSFSTTAFSNEPTGISFDPLSNRYFISDDDKKHIFTVNPGTDNQ